TEEHAAEPGGIFLAGGFGDGAVSDGDSGSRRWVDGARTAMHRENRARIDGGAEAAQGYFDGDYFSGAAVSVSGGGIGGGDGSAHSREGICVGAGRAGEYGRLGVFIAAAG